MAKRGTHAEAEVDKYPDRNFIYQKGNFPSERRQNREGNVRMVTLGEETQQLLLSPLLSCSIPTNAEL